MTIYYLQATDKQALWEAMETAGLAYKDYDPDDPDNTAPSDAPENWQPTGAYTWVSYTGMFDQIGSIYAPTGNMVPDVHGNLVPEMAPIDSFYYANLQDGVDIPALTEEQIVALPTIPAPASPYRIWAGDE